MKKLFACLISFTLLSGYFPVLSQTSEDIVLPYERLGHLLLVRATIDGSESTFNFIIDTGGATFLDKNVVRALNLKEQGPMAKITSLGLYGQEIQNIFCFTTFDFDIFERIGTPVHGIIGSNLMERYKVTFDFNSQKIVFSSDTALVRSLEGVLYCEFRNHPVNNAPIISLNLNGHAIDGMIDTGQPYPLVLPLEESDAYADAGNVPFIKSHGLMEYWPQTTATHNYLARIPSCSLGDLRLSNMVCLFAELPAMLSMPLIGNDLLSQFQMVINYPGDELLLIPAAGFHPADNVFTVGLNPNITGEGTIVVEGVWERSPAFEAGIRPGDEIIAVNGHNGNPGNISEIIQILEDEEVKRIRLVVQKKDGQMKVRLRKRMLF
jgi:predicted aspartyl protease